MSGLQCRIVRALRFTSLRVKEFVSGLQPAEVEYHPFLSVACEMKGRNSS